ncbi:MAG: hypothetical protein LBQ88_11565 [Treponema sp.]|jgi:hypothetical protein|nr:hypothetical protein [Treponema sp.]
MKKGKIVFVSLVLMLVCAAGTFAQERKGYIKPTFGLGFGSASGGGSSISGMAMSFDVDFVNSIGVTLGVQNIFLFSDLGLNLHPFGAGYTYDADNWSVGGKLMAVPTSLVDGGFGFDVNGSYWFNENIGLTGIIDLYFGTAGNGGTVFSLRVGVSTKF